MMTTIGGIDWVVYSDSLEFWENGRFLFTIPLEEGDERPVCQTCKFSDFCDKLVLDMRFSVYCESSGSHKRMKLGNVSPKTVYGAISGKVIKKLPKRFK